MGGTHAHGRFDVASEGTQCFTLTYPVVTSKVAKVTVGHAFSRERGIFIAAGAPRNVTSGLLCGCFPQYQSKNCPMVSISSRLMMRVALHLISASRPRNRHLIRNAPSPQNWIV